MSRIELESGEIGGDRPGRAPGERNPRGRGLFKRFKIREEISDLRGIKLKLRHGRMACHNAFGERLLQIINRVALMQSAERRCDIKRAVARSSDAVAHRAIRLRENAPALSTRFLSRRERSGKTGRDQANQNSRSCKAMHR